MVGFILCGVQLKRLCFSVFLPWYGYVSVKVWISRLSVISAGICLCCVGFLWSDSTLQAQNTTWFNIFSVCIVLMPLPYISSTMQAKVWVFWNLKLESTLLKKKKKEKGTQS